MGESVKVIVRCRPMNNREKGLNCKSIINIDSKIGQCSITNPNEEKAAPKPFTFDGAYDINSITEQIYADIGYPLVEGVTEGYNGTIFAYGQTGAGKSFSMQGITDPPSQRGIIPRAFDHIFETIQVSEGVKYLVHATYLEIYNEEIRDLLGSDIKQKLDLKERPDGGVFVQGLGMHPCKNVRDCERIMEKGWSHRSVGATLMNADSSRSHSIFTIHLERCDNDDKGEGHIRAAKLNLVDLAGSERQGKTGATGDRLKEATKINLSLSALGNVISALVDGKSTHIPYRDSKLTRLLQDSLGGNTKTLMVACLSPADNNYDETLSTLRYANRAKNIKNKPKINEDPKDAMLREFQDEIKRLKALLDGTPLGGSGGAQSEPQIVEKIVHVQNDEKIEEEKRRLREEFEEQMAQMKAEFDTMKMSKEKLEEEMNYLRDNYDQKVDAVYDGKDVKAVKVKKSKTGSNKSEKATKTKQRQGKNENSISGPSDDGFSNGQFKESNDADDDYADDFEQQEAIHVTTHVAQDAIKRLKELEQQMVGGEQANNEEVKQQRQKKKKYAEERKRKLQVALEEKDGDDILVDVYDNIHDELRFRTKTLEKQKRKNEELLQELEDLKAEFNSDRSDYLETIRKQEKDIKWYTALVDRIHPCLRRDCNYIDLDRVRVHSTWDEEKQQWMLPKMTIEQTKLPAALPGVKQQQPMRSHSPLHNMPAYDGDGNNDDIYEQMHAEDKYLRRLQERDNQDVANEYFKNKRAEKLLAKQNNGRVSSSLRPMNGSMMPSYSSPAFDSDMADIRSANHGYGRQMMDDSSMRPPKALNSLSAPGSSNLMSRRK